MIKKHFSTLTRTAKKIGLPLVLLLPFYLIYEYVYGYTNFDVEDVRQPAVFTFKKATRNPHYTMIEVHIKGEIKGRARVKVDYCGHLKDTNYWYTPRLNLVVTGKVDTVMRAENYSGHACIEYKPKNVERGELSIAVAAR
ncbi:hypothetical protein [Spirosoma aerophilum]